MTKKQTKVLCQEPKKAVFTDYGVATGYQDMFGTHPVFKVERYQRYEDGTCTNFTHTVAEFDIEEHAHQYAARMRGGC